VGWCRHGRNAIVSFGWSRKRVFRVIHPNSRRSAPTPSSPTFIIYYVSFDRPCKTLEVYMGQPRVLLTSPTSSRRLGISLFRATRGRTRAPNDLYGLLTCIGQYCTGYYFFSTNLKVFHIINSFVIAKYSSILCYILMVYLFKRHRKFHKVQVGKANYCKLVVLLFSHPTLMSFI